ncbi:unnamed protein product [Caenorhabditis auriculariae]|uniref:Uncharacterized protein n=1 Tax=Caenorhabditis auriculariae TaxID=2777116 RepID=A0A8S1GXR6_9PELO|nr:unnamed protein product [Caenorhabditis auriculariae]
MPRHVRFASRLCFRLSGWAELARALGLICFYDEACAGLGQFFGQLKPAEKNLKKVRESQSPTSLQIMLCSSEDSKNLADLLEDRPRLFASQASRESSIATGTQRGNCPQSYPAIPH